MINLVDDLPACCSVFHNNHNDNTNSNNDSKNNNNNNNNNDQLTTLTYNKVKCCSATNCSTLTHERSSVDSLLAAIASTDLFSKLVAIDAVLQEDCEMTAFICLCLVNFVVCVGCSEIFCISKTLSSVICIL
jgi:hypothetical protein